MSTSRPAELFTPDRKLLNPRFETYRLQSLDPSAARGHRLPGEGATQSRVGYGKQQLGFKEVRSRISWDHLDTRGNRGVYVDVEWNVVGFELDVSSSLDLLPSGKLIGAPLANDRTTSLRHSRH